jgi:formylglycine-generating enzyme required for sulfatase activity
MEIWLRQEGEEYGPYTLEQVKEFVASGESVLEDEAWFEGCEDYVTVGDIPNFTSPRKITHEEHGKKKNPIVIASFIVSSVLLVAGLVVGGFYIMKGSSGGEGGPVDEPPTEPVKGESFSIPDVNLDMLWCKPGTFMMGSPEDEKDRDDDETQLKVTLTQGFYLGKHEVTQEQWEKVMGTNPSYHKGAALPVEKVSWDDAMEFCKKLTQMEKEADRLPKGWTYTLPTEAQWEYACRAGTTTAYSFGDTITPKQANYDGNVGKTTPVGTYPANAWGFHDMHGNVWERCLDWYGDYPDGSASDPVGPSVGSIRVLRGGSWINYGRNMRSAYRFRYSPVDRFYSLGFRLSLQTGTAKTE